MRYKRDDFGMEGTSVIVFLFTPDMVNVDDPDGPKSRGRFASKMTTWVDLRSSLHLIRLMIRDAEMHEADEWLKLDGKWVKNPHGKESWLR